MAFFILWGTNIVRAGSGKDRAADERSITHSADFIYQPREDRRVYWEQTAARMSLSTQIVEKDFRVSQMVPQVARRAK
jgi:hypothetical protein